MCRTIIVAPLPIVQGRRRHDSDLRIESGMTFHVLSWLIGTGRDDAFVSDTVLVAEGRAEVPTVGE